MATITHYSKRNAERIAAGRLDGSPAWLEQFDGTRAEAEAWILEAYGRAPCVERGPTTTAFRFVGFALFVN